MNETPETQSSLLTRREFVQTSLTGLGGLVVAFYVPTALQKAFAATPAGATAVPQGPNAFIRIAPDDTITMVINKLEMGQGVNTSLAQLIAEELECDWTKIQSVSAPVAAVYNHTMFGTQMTGGSSALASSWEQHRKIGASMREMLKAAAAQKWGVPVSEVKAENGAVTHRKHGRLTYGQLADQAAQMPMPADVKLKSARDFKVIGTSKRRVDATDKSNGKAQFGMDVRLPGMLYVMVARPPRAGAKLASVNDRAARAVKGVVDVVRVGDRVAVLAKNTHASRMGRDALNVQWTGGKRDSDASLMAGVKKEAAKPGILAKESGDARQALAAASKKFTAEYEFPYLAHASMEPLNCTVDYDGKRARFWAGFQMPTIENGVAAKILGLPPEKVEINTTYAGGSFGRRACKHSDYLTEAATLAKAIKKPMKVMWTREDDMRAGYYRPMTYHRVNWGVTADGKLAGWDHLIAGNSVIGGSMFEPMMVKNGLEGTVTEGVANTHYAIANFRCEQTRVPSPITTLWWRSVGHTHTAYVMETMIDEVAEATGIDPLKLRKQMLKESPRHMAVLKELEKLSGWGKRKAPEGRAWGLAIHESFNSVVGQVAEVSMQNGQPKVHRVWAAVHCGQVVNPEGAKSQVESSIAFGLSAALYQKISIDQGEVKTSNFHDYRVLRLPDMPQVEVAFVETEDAPTGLGEPGLPPIAPAVANAVYVLTRKRVRKLPFSDTTFT